MKEPDVKRVIAFVDGQNLFHSAMKAFGYNYPNYDVKALSEAICKLHDWKLKHVRFYTGVPDLRDNAYWHTFWSIKIPKMKMNGIWTFKRKVRYSENTIEKLDGSTEVQITRQEKGVDVRIAIDMIRLALKDEYDTALIFSEDQDFSEVVDEIRSISHERPRWIGVVCAFPKRKVWNKKKNDYVYTRGINNTTWYRIEKELYTRCLDPYNYRSKIHSMSGQTKLSI